MFEEKFFAHRKLNPSKLLPYGFAEENGVYRYTTALLNGQLQLFVSITPDGAVSTQIIDNATDEEYLLYKVSSSVGSYVGSVRTACEAVLTDISHTCYAPDVFRGEQTLALIDFVRATFGDELEFLWDTFPENAVWRRKDNRKWYGLLVTISKRKLGLPSDAVVEAVDLRLSPEQMAETVDNARYFPGWHMNKKSWYTMILDGSVPTEELCRRIEESYRLASKK